MAKKSKKVLNIQRRSKHQQRTESQVEALSSEDAVSTTYYVHGPRGIHAQQKDGDWTWMIQDGANSIRGVTDNDLAVRQSIVYDPFGNPIAVVGPDQTVYGYTGEPTDLNALVYLRERYYNPAIGTFISQDRVEGSMNNPMSLNTYAYVQGDPVNRTDPSGLTSVNLNAMQSLMQSNPRAFAQMMNAGMCPVLQSSQDACEELLRREAQPSIRQLVAAGCIPLQPIPIQPGQEILPVITPTVGAGLRLPVDNGRLSNCDFDSRTPNGIPSRDVNPLGAANSVPVYAPVNGEVMIVDNTGDNAGLGNFVAIRIPTGNLPANISAQLGDGYVYIGYAHLSQVNVQASGDPPYMAVSGGQQIGMTGAGGERGQIHLDVTVFFVPRRNASGVEPAPWTTGTEENVGGVAVPEYQYFQSFYTLGRSAIYEPQLVDPLFLWPELAQGTTCTAGG